LLACLLGARASLESAVAWEFSIIKKQQQPLCKMVKRLAQLGSSKFSTMQLLYQLLTPLEAEKAVTSQAQESRQASWDWVSLSSSFFPFFFHKKI
jgi:hypothetical protein